MFVSLIYSAPGDGGFTEREVAVINSDFTYPVMRLFLSDNQEDLEILRRKCDPVDASVIGTAEYDRLLKGMLNTVVDPENTGVGIAAPQVGVNKRIILVQRFDKEDEDFGFYLNPRIVSTSREMVESEEGCLSVPDARGCVMRHASITIEYNHPKDFRLCREDIEGFTAIIFQHETDHLDGLLFTDKLTTAPYYGEI